MLSVRVWLRLPQTRLWVQGQRRGAFGSSRERILNSESTSTRVQSCGRIRSPCQEPQLLVMMSVWVCEWDILASSASNAKIYKMLVSCDR